MKRRTRTEILVKTNAGALKDLCTFIEDRHDIVTLEEPNNGLVMVKMRESAQNSLFYLGEVFVTECKVMLGDEIGIGLIKGAHQKKAYYLGVIDAAYNAGVPECLELDRRIEKLKETIDKEKALHQDQILKTKVDFETLDEEVKA